MADATFRDSMQIMRDNLTAMGQQCHANIIKTLPYSAVQGNTLPIITFVVSGTSYKRSNEGMQLFTVNLKMTVVVDQFTAGFEGNRQQDAYFDYLPTILQYFAQHPRLSYLGSGGIVAAPPYLDEDGTAITSAQVGNDRNNDNQRIVITLNWNVLFRTSFASLC